MNFWQLVSILRDDRQRLEAVLKDGGWPEYAKWLERFDELVSTQNRQILDAVLPEDLVLKALRASNLTFYISENILRQIPEELKQQKGMTVAQVYERYGAEAIEEVLEFGSWRLSKV